MRIRFNSDEPEITWKGKEVLHWVKQNAVPAVISGIEPQDSRDSQSEDKLKKISCDCNKSK